MRSPLVALVFVACSGSADPTTSPPPNHPGGSAIEQAGGSGAAAAPKQDSQDSPDSRDSRGSQASPAGQGSQAMSTDRRTPGDTGVDEHGVLLRSKPDPNAPKADAALVADDAAQLLFYAGALVGDPAIQRRVWQQLGLADAAGAPTPRMTEFIRAHQEWVKVKASAAATVATPAKAKAYLDAHLK